MTNLVTSEIKAMVPNAMAIIAKPGIQSILAHAIHHRRRDQIARCGRDDEHPELNQGVREDALVRSNHGEDERAGNGVAVISEIHQEPGQTGADQADQKDAVADQDTESLPESFPAARCLLRLAASGLTAADGAENGGGGLVKLVMLAVGKEIARRFGHLPAHIEHHPCALDAQAGCRSCAGRFARRRRRSRASPRT